MLYSEPHWSPRQRRNLACLCWQAAWIARGAKIYRWNLGSKKLVNDWELTPIRNKTIMVKEADELLVDKNLLAALRDLYDKGAVR